MINNEKLGESEAIAFITTTMSTKVFLTTPAIIVDLVGCSAWMAVLISGLVTIMFFWVILKYLDRFPDKIFSETAEDIVGPYIGILFSLILFILWFAETSLTLRLFSEMMIINALPRTPISIIVAVFATIAVIAAYMGIKTIAQACYILFPVSLGAILLIGFLTFHLWETDWLFPLFGNGPWPVVKYGLLRVSDLAELNFIYVFPMYFYPKQFKHIGYKSIGISMMIFFAVVLTYTLSFPVEVGKEMYLPLYMMARNIYLGRFLQRVEVIFMLFWVLSGCLWISAGFFGASVLLAGLLKLPEYKPLMVPLAIISFSVAFIPANLPDLVIFVGYYVRNTIFVAMFGIPIILLIIAFIRKKGANPNAST
jgi:spore germination protein KB